MGSVDRVARRWVEALVDGKSGQVLRSGPMFAQADTIYWQGWPFASLLRHGGGPPRLFLINGAMWGTGPGPGPVSAVLSAITAWRSVPSVTIPFTVLDASGITIESIEVVDVQAPLENIGDTATVIRPLGLARRSDIPVTRHVHEGVTSPFEFPRANSVHWNFRILGPESLREDEVLFRAATVEDDSGSCQRCRGTGHQPVTLITTAGPETGPQRGHGVCPECGGRGVLRSMRWAYYLSAFDEQEPIPAYFLCELPGEARPTSLETAFQALKPAAVKHAELIGRVVRRQGDIFAIPTALTTNDLLTRNARIVRQGDLLGTNHRASEVAYLPDGVTLARGSMDHRPRGRRPDHVQQWLGNGQWHVIVRNTVPVTTPTRRRA